MSRARRVAALATGVLVGGWGARTLVRRARAWRLHGRVAVVTGGTRGLGLLIARELLADGCRVAICGRDEETLRRAVELLGEPPELLAQSCDVGDQAQVRSFMAAVAAQFGPVELLITNAATMNVGRVETMDAADFESAMRDTFHGTLYPLLEVLPAMRERGEGRIGVISSIGGRVSFPHLLPYAAAKYAQVGLAEGLRAELAGDGITVTTIIPGFMRTGSFLAADFHTPARDEYSWFAASAVAPIVTLSPEWAARRVVQAIRHGEADVTLGWFARLGGTIKSLMPGLSADVLGTVDRFVLPDGTDNGDGPATGADIHSRAPTAVRAMAEPVVSRTVDELNQPG